MSVEIVIHVKGSEELRAKLDLLKMMFRSQALLNVLTRAKNDLVSIARKLAPKRSFLLSRSIDGRVEGFGTGDVKVVAGTSLRYAPHVEYGTKPRPIDPVSKKALFWVNYSRPRARIVDGGGEDVGAVFTFASHVDHPGNKPQPFMRPALKTVKPRLVQALGRMINEEWRKARGS